MSRAEMRRAAREAEKKRTATYNLTQEQLDAIVAQKVNEFVDKEFAKLREQVMNDAVVAAVRATYMIPLKIIKDKYWPKSYKRKLPGLAKEIVEMFDDWQNGRLDLRATEQELWDDAGVRFEEI